MGKLRRWNPGDLFAIPLDGEEFLVGQVLAHEPFVLNSVACVLVNARWRHAQDAPAITRDQAFSILFTTRDRLDRKLWAVIGSAPIVLPQQDFPYESLRERRFVGARVIGAGIVEVFARAYCGLAPWNSYKDPEYFDKLLVGPDKKPGRVVLK